MVVNVLLMVALSVVSIFMILLILVQRGKGGGLAGAFGGMGGQSAFGTKAGDMFTKITMWSAFVWIVLCAFTVWYMGRPDKDVFPGGQAGGTPTAQQNLIIPGDPEPSGQNSSTPKSTGTGTGDAGDTTPGDTTDN